MKTRAVRPREAGVPWRSTELEPDPAKADEVPPDGGGRPVPLRRAHPRQRQRAAADGERAHRKMPGSLSRGANPPRASPLAGEPAAAMGTSRSRSSLHLITKKCRLDEINLGYQDLMDGKGIRGVVAHQH
jgi:hypothetical protein